MDNSEKITREELLNIINYMETGVLENTTGEKRKFDAVDYYLMAHMGPRSFLNIVERMLPKKLSVVKNYIAENKKYLTEKHLPQNVLNMYYNYRNHEITGSEKLQILKFLTENEIPINNATFTYAMRKHIDGVINITPINKKTQRKTRVKKK